MKMGKTITDLAKHSQEKIIRGDFYG